jgi:uncharacterized protein YndB with AHSA1/START domain
MSQRILRKEVKVSASPAEVFRAWTTRDGVREFFSPDARIELRIGGPYEPLFLLSEPPGEQGAEGCKVLSFLPAEMLSFSWNAPPHLPNVRKERTWVVLQFDPAGAGATRVRAAQLGWGEGEEWDQCYVYFDRAWDVVLGRLQERFERGPVDWAALD